MKLEFQKTIYHLNTRTKHFYDGLSLIADSDKTRETRNRFANHEESKKSITKAFTASRDEETRTAIGLKSAIIAKPYSWSFTNFP